MHTPPHNRKFLAVCVLALLGVSFLVASENQKIAEALRLEQEHTMMLAQAVAQTDVLAKAFSVYDITAQEKIFGKNDETPMPMASLVKTMTVLVTLGSHAADETVTLSPQALAQTGDFGLLPNEKWNIEDLARFTLIVSANDGAYALAETTPDFLSKMNDKAKRIGMKETTFLNPTGLDIGLKPATAADPITLQAGAMTSALDANIMAGYALKAMPEIFSVTTLPEITLTSLSGISHTFKNTDIVIDQIPNIVFSKTGYTDLTGGNLTVVFRDKREHLIAVTVLNSTFAGRFDDLVKIVGALGSL